MKSGKVPVNILKRAVLRQTGTKREEVLNGAGMGRDCAIFPFGGNGSLAGCMQEAAVRTDTNAAKAGEPPAGNAGVQAGCGKEGAVSAGQAGAGEEFGEAFMTLGELIQKCANNLAAGGALPLAAMITLLLPENTEEAVLRGLMEEAAGKCRELSMEIAGGQSRVTAAVNSPVAVVTGYGRLSGEGHYTGRAEPGQDVVLSKWIGLQGTAVLARRNRESLLERYPAYLVEEAGQFDRFLSVLPEAEIAVRNGVCAMHDASEGGIFGALWEMAEGSGVGLRIDLRKLPLRQETVEVCECCNANPYELLSGGCLVMTTKDGFGLAAALEAEHIPAVVVGKVTSGKERVLCSGEEIRYMNRPERDGVYGRL